MIEEIKKILNKKKYFLLSYSGGLDSTVLLHLLLQLNKKINIYFRAIHVNHKLHIDSNSWSNHCKKECLKYNIPLIIENIHLNKKNNIESEARSMRYQAIYKHVLSQEVILTAHNLNDQCETFLLAAKRGSGPKGLSSMGTYKNTDNIIHIRPLLNIDRDEIKSWAIANQLKWIEDHSNLDTYYDRNFLRKKIIPILKKRWPSFIKNCTRSAKLCYEQEKLLNYFSTPILKKNILPNGSLDISNITHLNYKIQNIILRNWIALHNVKMPSYKGLNIIHKEIINSRQDASPKINFKEYEIRRYKQEIHLIKPVMPSIKHIIISWHKPFTSLMLPNKLGYITKNKMGIKLPSPKKIELVNIRFQASGSFYIQGQNHKKKLKKIWQILNIPTWKRENIPLLFYNNHFISALGVFVINNFNTKRNHYWYLSWHNTLTKNS